MAPSSPAPRRGFLALVLATVRVLPFFAFLGALLWLDLKMLFLSSTVQPCTKSIACVVSQSSVSGVQTLMIRAFGLVVLYIIVGLTLPFLFGGKGKGKGKAGSGSSGGKAGEGA